MISLFQMMLQKSAQKPALAFMSAFRLLWAVLLGASLLSPMLLGSSSWAHTSPPPVSLDKSTEGFNRFTLPVGTPLQVYLQVPVSTRVNQIGDPVEARIAQTVYLDQSVLLTRNSRALGQITKLEPPVAGHNAILQVRFNELVLDNGEKLPIQAYVKTDLPDHTWGGELTTGTKPKLVVNRVHGIGEYNRVVMMGPRLMGQHVEFLPGEFFTLILEQEATVFQPATD